MPVYRGRTVLDIARGVKAFLSLEAGIGREVAPDFEPMFEQAQRQIRQKNQQIQQLRKQLTHEERKRDRLQEQPGRKGPVERRLQVQAENTYEALYETHARVHSAEDSVGGSFDLVGRLELQLLLAEGLKPTGTLLDLGCGTGRLAVHAIPALAGGAYIGIDISRSMIDAAQNLVRETIPDPPCQVHWAKQTTPAYPLDTDSVDVVCAFSVFTHMEHEDAYRYLKEARRIVRPGGRFIFSCLPMNLNLARTVFLQSAGADLESRWSEVRNVTTSVDFMNEIVRLAGWTPVRWYDGEERNIRLPDIGELHMMGQSVCVLRASDESVEE